MAGLHEDQRGLLRVLTGRAEADRSRATHADPDTTASDTRAADAGRYARQVRFAPFGADAQRRLGDAHALVVGCGALGTHIATWLWRAGVGRLTIVDRDIVDLGNLQRQILFDDADALAGVPKAEAAVAALARLRGPTGLTGLVADFDPALFATIEPRVDVILDGTDNFGTRFRINDLAIRDGLPWIHGAAVGSSGRAMVVVPGTTPCLRCLLPDAPPTGEIGTCETVGVLAPAVATVAAFQVTEALKLLGGRTTELRRGMLTLDTWTGEHAVRFADAAPRPDCPSCGTRELPALVERTADATSLCGRDAVQVRPGPGATVDLARLGAALSGAGIATATNERWLRFEADGCRFTVFPDGRALVLGTADPGRARALYDRYVGAGA